MKVVIPKSPEFGEMALELIFQPGPPFAPRISMSKVNVSSSKPGPFSTREKFCGVEIVRVGSGRVSGMLTFLVESR